MATVYYWIIIILIQTPQGMAENTVPIFQDSGFYKTDAACQKQMDHAEKLITDNKKVRQVVLHRCYQITYPTKPETDV